MFRNGQRVATFAAGTKSDNDIVQMMIGREYDPVFPAKPPPPPIATPPILELRHLSWMDMLNDVSLQVRAGGSRRPRRARRARPTRAAAVAVRRAARVTGDILIRGRKVAIDDPSQAKHPSNGLALIPEDRKTEGLMLPMSVGQNLPSPRSAGSHAGAWSIDRGTA